jgi:hypothetical protein
MPPAADRDERLARRSTTATDQSNTRIGTFWHTSTWQTGQTITHHAGQTGGYSSYLGFDRPARKAVIVLSDVANDAGDLASQLLADRKKGNVMNSTTVTQSTPAHTPGVGEDPLQSRGHLGGSWPARWPPDPPPPSSSPPPRSSRPRRASPPAPSWVGSRWVGIVVEGFWN